jgi:ParB-like chromosome segregation protein Spo0J
MQAAATETVKIPVERVDVPPGWRAPDEEGVAHMASSLRDLGLIHPITIGRNPDLPGRFNLICGLHRLLGARTLGWETIEARISEADATHAEMMTLSENLHRSPLSRTERDKAVKRWAELYRELHPEAETIRGRALAAQTRVVGGRFAPVERTGDDPEGVTAATAKTLGVSQRAVQKAINRASRREAVEAALPEPFLKVLDAAEATLDQQEEIVALEDAVARREIISLVGSGMAFEDAMTEVLGPDEPEPEPESPEALRARLLAACPIREHVNVAMFDADANLYYDLQDARIAFQRALNWSKLKASVRSRGPYFRRLARLLDAPDPSRWTRCLECDRGTFTRKDGQKVSCPACGGGGYLLG